MGLRQVDVSIGRQRRLLPAIPGRLEAGIISLDAGLSEGRSTLLPGAAAFDAYSTRLALSGNYGTESNPLLRPFAHSGALYAATQVSPVVMDFIGKRMMVSENRWMRRMWWLPQAAGSGFSIAAGVHNMCVVK